MSTWSKRKRFSPVDQISDWDFFMYLLGVLLLIIGSVNILLATHLHCYDDDAAVPAATNRSVQLHEHCRACILFIDVVNISSTVSAMTSAGKLLSRHHELSIDELISYQETKPNYRRRHRRQLSTPLRQSCARSSNGPLYGYNRTHCYCDSDRCNLNLHRCIYEVIAKSLFSCYHSSMTSERPLEIQQKCRACRLRRQSDATYHYECLTFAEEEHSNQTHCTCQHPLCNRDATICGRLLLPALPSTPARLTPTTLTSTQSSTLTSKRLETTSIAHNETSEEIVIDVPFTEEALLIGSTSIVPDETSSMRPEMMENGNHGQSRVPHAFVLTISSLLAFRVWWCLTVRK